MKYTHEVFNEKNQLVFYLDDLNKTLYWLHGKAVTGMYSSKSLLSVYGTKVKVIEEEEN